MISTQVAEPTAIAAEMIAGQLLYPTRVDAFEIQQELGTYSAFMESLSRSEGTYHFAQQIAEIYNSFAEGQKRLGAEFEAAIFSDLESLYEA